MQRLQDVVRLTVQWKNIGNTEKEEEEGTSCKPALIFAADNVDHCLRTLDGAGTFHGMRMIAMINNPKHR